MRYLLSSLLLLLLTDLSLQAQEARQFTAEEKATHTRNSTAILSKWKTIHTAIQIEEDALKPKQAELENIYNGLFNQSVWEFTNTGKCTLTTFSKGNPTTEEGTFTVNAQFLTLYIGGKTYRCLMKIEEDGKMIIHFPITVKSIYALQLEKQPG